MLVPTYSQMMVGDGDQSGGGRSATDGGDRSSNNGNDNETAPMASDHTTTTIIVCVVFGTLAVVLIGIAIVWYLRRQRLAKLASKRITNNGQATTAFRMTTRVKTPPPAYASDA
ncbi:hypothetical protein OIO90_003811 [Microbotryomycetes sp. JL221]|nr:hypothetical protein OIO90_003811 [Microbotryomycetes sp. JL221]